MKKIHLFTLFLFVSTLTFAEGLPAQMMTSSNRTSLLNEDITFTMQITNGDQFYDGAIVDFQWDVCNTATTPVENAHIGYVFNTTIFDHLSLSTSYPSVNSTYSNVGLFVFDNMDIPVGGCVTITFSLAIHSGAPLGIVNNMAAFVCFPNQYNASASFEIIPCPPSSTDLNDDGITNAGDLILFLGAFNTSCAAGDCCSEDFNDDGLINSADLLILLSAFPVFDTDEKGPNLEKNQLEYVKEFTYSPNPVANRVEFQLNVYPYQPCYLDIYSASGELIQRYDDLKRGTLSVDMSELNSGLYFVHFFNGIELEVTKLIKE